MLCLGRYARLRKLAIGEAIRTIFLHGVGSGHGSSSEVPAGSETSGSSSPSPMTSRGGGEREDLGAGQARSATCCCQRYGSRVVAGRERVWAPEGLTLLLLPPGLPDAPIRPPLGTQATLQPPAPRPPVPSSCVPEPRGRPSPTTVTIHTGSRPTRAPWAASLTPPGVGPGKPHLCAPHLASPSPQEAGAPWNPGWTIVTELRQS